MSCWRNSPGWRDDPRTKCALVECRDHGICNSTYARIHLQAGIASRRETELPFAEFYFTLREALACIRNDLAKPSTKFPVFRSQLNDLTSFRCASHNPVFCDKLSIALCEAALLVLDLMTSGRYRPPWSRYFVRQHRVLFWLRNLACYLGDIEMLEFYTNEVCGNETSDQIRAEEDRKLLGTAAAKGHEIIVQFLLPPQELRRCDVYLALRGACYSGSANTAETLLSRTRHQDLDSLCSQPLSGWRNSVRLSPNYPAVATVIDEHYERSSKLLRTPVSLDTGNPNASPPGRNLIQHSQGTATVLWPPDRHARLHEILRYACLNRDVTCFRAILAEIAVEKIHTSEPFSLMSNLFHHHAISSNSFAILQEIYRFTGRGIHTIYLSTIACLEGSIDIMAKKLEMDPDLIRHPTIATPELHGAVYELPGAIELKCAAAQLRVDNVKFLLQRGARIRAHQGCRNGPRVFWRYRRLHEEQFQAIQTLLRQYGCPDMIVHV